MALTDKQLALRRTGVTATDLCALFGVDAYGRTAHDVWLDKMGMASSWTPTEAQELGLELEPIVLQRLAAKVGLHRLRIDPETLTRRHPFEATHLATPDALFAPHAFAEVEALGQVKVVGQGQWHRWGKDPRVDSPPDGVIIQCAWELHVCREAPVDYVGALIGTEVRVYPILAKDVGELTTQACEVADKFWRDHVVTKKPPRLDGSEGADRLVSALYPWGKKGLKRKAPAAAEPFAARYFAALAALKAAKLEQSKARQALITLCGSAECMEGDGWRLSARSFGEQLIKTEYLRRPGRAVRITAKKGKTT